MIGQIIKLLSGVYTVQTPQGVYLCRARGNFRSKGLAPVPGDEVEILPLPDHAGRIDQIMPRRNYLIRPNVANVDILCYISSYGIPSPSTFTIDKMLVIAQTQGIQPILVFNKTDCSDSDGVLPALYRNLGFTVFETSARTGAGCKALLAALAGKTAVFAGNSGVGKSSLLNRLFPSLQLTTGEISQKLGRGRHTTRHIEFFSVNHGLIGDTPGFGALELSDYPIERQALADCYPEFSAFTADCAYTDCTHINERVCGVRSAVEAERITQSRYESYRQIYDFLKGEEAPWLKKNAR